MKSQRLLLY